MTAVNILNHNLAFVHIPKNGGSSIVQWLRTHAGPLETQRGHANLDMMKQLWTFDRSFAVVRNPWSRAVSAYFYLKQGQYYWENNNIRTIDEFPTWNDFLINLSYSTDSWHDMKTNQIDWMGDGVDIILRTETLDKDFKIIQDLLNCQMPLLHINTSDHSDYRSYYTTDQIKHIEKVFERDIDIFKYSF